MMCFNVDNFPYCGLIKSSSTVEKPKRAKGKKYNKKIINAVCAFDIETSNFKTHTKTINGCDICGMFLPVKIDTRFTQKYATMYIWQFAFTKDFVCIGRTWLEFIQFIERLEEQINSDEKLVIYVHNLSFEFQFLKGIFDFDPKCVFCMDSRKILYTTLHDKIEFRCSYLLSNMSLKDFTKKMKVEHIKLDGNDFNYDIKRYSWTKLSEKELEYCINDVVGLVESIEVLMNTENDDLYSVPLTSTGYVRRDMKTAMKTIHYCYWKSLQPNYDIYKMLRQAFRGGNTHANRLYVGECYKRSEIIYRNYNVITRDIASSYPAVMLNGYFPVTEFMEVIPKTGDLCDDFNYLKNVEKEGRKRWAILFTVTFNNIRLKNDKWGAPYLAKDKCIISKEKIIETTRKGRSRKFIEKVIDSSIYDNGRIIKSREIETTITDIDFDIINKQYKWDNMMIKKLYISEYGPLPECIKDVVRKYFKLKTEYKGADGDDEIYYTKAKNKLNACFGLFATNPVRAIIELCDLYLEHNLICDNAGMPCKTYRKKIVDDEEIKSQLDKLEKNPQFPYQWGVWVTALARMQLERGIDIVYEHYNPLTCYFVYCDTDSVKYVDTFGVVNWDDFNNEVKAQSIKNGGVAWSKDRNGNLLQEYVLGIYELDDKCPVAKEFVTMGAKRYAYTDSDDNVHITIAGVGKIKGGKELEKLSRELAYINGKKIEDVGKLYAFRDGVIFSESGGQIAHYTDHELPPKINAFGVERITSNIYLEDTQKEISRTKDYEILTNMCANERQMHINFIYANCKEYINSID